MFSTFLAISIVYVCWQLGKGSKKKQKELNKKQLKTKNEFKKAKDIAHQFINVVKNDLVNNLEIDCSTQSPKNNIPQSVSKYYEKSTNPKFHRTYEEKELERAFLSEYRRTIDRYNEKIYNDTQQATNSITKEDFNFDNMICLHQKAIDSFYKFQKFCFNSGKGGKIYFEDMWMHCHNSQNECFNFIDKFETWIKDAKSNYHSKKAYYDSLSNVKYEIKKILCEKGEAIQKELYNQFLPLKASDVYKVINNLKSEGFLYTEKYLNTHKLIKITEQRKPPEKWSVVVDGIEPLFGYTPNISELTNKQVSCYKKIVKQISAGKFVDVGDSRAYIFLYIYDEFEKAAENNDISNIKNILLALSDMYKNDKVFPLYINNWLADCYVISKEYDKALKIYQTENNIDCLWSLKYNLKLPIAPKEILSISLKNYFTSFVNNKLDKVEKHLNTVLDNEKIDKDYIQYLGNKYKNNEYQCPLFVGIPSGYELNQLNKDMSFISFRSISEISELCKRICRNAENMLREEMGIPRVGEGWVSETELYYKIKELIPAYEVVHHYRNKWLGRQHLDIYIPDLKLAFEYQGLQHSKPIDFFGGKEAFLKNKKRDEEKKEKCIKENIYLVEVYPDYDFEYIKGIIKDKLN